MIPSLARLRVSGHRRTIRLWLPLFLLWPLALPFAGVLAVVALVCGVAPAGALRAAWQLACGSRGLHVEVDSPGFGFQVRLS